jgi:hypothetical protein
MDARKSIDDLKGNLDRDEREGFGFVFREGGQIREGYFR